MTLPHGSLCISRPQGLWAYEVLSWPHTLSSSKGYSAALSLQGAQLAMVTISHLHPAKLKTEEKRLWMTPTRVDAWNQAILASTFTDTGTLIDLHHLTKGAGLCLSAPSLGPSSFCIF